MTCDVSNFYVTGSSFSVTDSDRLSLNLLCTLNFERPSITPSFLSNQI